MGAIEIECRAFELYPVPAPLPIPEVPARWEDALRPLAEAVGIEVHARSYQPRTRKAHEAACFARERGSGVPMRAAIFEAYWNEGRDIGRIDVLVELGVRLGLDRTAMKIELDIDRYADSVLRDRAAAVQAGVEGTPTLFIGTGPDARVLIGAQPYEEIDAAISLLPGA